MTKGRKSIETAKNNIFKTIETIYEASQMNDIKKSCLELRATIEEYANMGYNEGMKIGEIEKIDSGVKSAEPEDLLSRLKDAKEYISNMNIPHERINGKVRTKYNKNDLSS